tara:strand:- start:1580 stop:2557 length:978 start_codon:yes stop_codon:yes gene_type:complete
MGFTVGVIGCGRWGLRHLATLEHLKSDGFIDKIFACDINPSRKNILPSNVDGFFEDWREMVHSEEFDLVSIVTPNSTHAPLGTAILKFGINVLVEKPLGVSISEVRELCAAAEKSEASLFSGYLLRYHSGIQFAQQLIQAKKIGQVKSLRYTKHSSRNKPEKADIIQNLASHAFSIIPELLDTEQIPLLTATVLTTDNKPAPLESANHAHFHMVYSFSNRPQPVNAEVQVGWGLEELSKLTIEGSRANLRIHFLTHDSIEQGSAHAGYAWVQTPHSNPPLEQQYREILDLETVTKDTISAHLQTAELLDKATSLASQWYQLTVEN